MRMWMVDPRLMCRQHLLGEHSEIHKHRHVFVRGWSVEGRRGQIEPRAMKRRHDDLAREMRRRGYRHDSPYTQPSLRPYRGELNAWRVDRVTSLAELSRRCPACEHRQRLTQDGQLQGGSD